jgi:ethanolamine utilization protein EutN
MQVGRVVGTLVATRKHESLVGMKLLLVQPLNLRLRPEGSWRVMVDAVGAGTGELVLYVQGAAARHAVKKADSAIDATVAGIVDSLEVAAEWLEPGPESAEADGGDPVE